MIVDTCELSVFTVGPLSNPNFIIYPNPTSKMETGDFNDSTATSRNRLLTNLELLQRPNSNSSDLYFL